MFCCVNVTPSYKAVPFGEKQLDPPGRRGSGLGYRFHYQMVSAPAKPRILRSEVRMGMPRTRDVATMI